ncbi:MAG: helix-turn-helix domain-containing protein, partial [Deltaproteobacteria bacterium]|nr:helix-turn-helix domain-containing protein [Deltaproteobacteria bacterium]
ILGWKAAIEKRIPGSLEAVDIELQKGDLKVAVEISSTTKPIQEIQNIRKCLEAGYEYIICVSPEDNRLTNLKTQSVKAFTFRERERFRFCSPKRLKNILESLSPSGIDSGNRIVSEKIPPQKQLLDTKEASELLGIKKNTLYEWVIQRKIPFVKVGRLTKFRRDALEEWLKKRSRKEETF